jgi:uncharacterized protein (DUF2062 family)
LDLVMVRALVAMQMLLCKDSRKSVAAGMASGMEVRAAYGL